MLANTLGQVNLCHLNRRFRGQARSYTESALTLEICAVHRSVGAGLLANTVGQINLCHLNRRFRGQARSYTGLALTPEIYAVHRSVGVSLLAIAPFQTIMR